MGNTVLTATFTNFSATTWNRDQMGWSLEEGASGITQQPPTQLMAGSGGGTLQYQQDVLGAVAAGDAGIWCCWNNGVVRFGVKLWAPKQAFDIGDRPYWYHMNDTKPGGSKDNINWVKLSDPSEQYVWPSGIGYQINASPVSEHYTLDISILIQDSL